jgi:hypothetical protein
VPCARPLVATAIVLAVAACGESPRELSWEVRFDAPATSARAVRVETRILSGGCDAATEVYVANVAPASPTGPVPGLLSPGRYGFEAVAWDAECIPFARACQEHVLPEVEAFAVTLQLMETETDPACAVERCEVGTCREGPGDAGTDAPDAAPDADTDPPLGPLLLGQGVPTASTVALDLPAETFIVASGFADFRQAGSGGGWVSSKLELGGAAPSSALTVTSRDGENGNWLRAGSTLLAPASADPSPLSHTYDSAGYDFLSERWAWGAIASGEVVAWNGAESADTTLQRALSVDDDVVALVQGHTTGTRTATGPDLVFELRIDSTTCGRSDQTMPGTIDTATVGSSFFCLARLAGGAHVVEGEVTFRRANVDALAFEYVLIQSGRVTPFGTTRSERVVPLTLPGRGVLLASAWQRFGGSAGWGEVAVLVDSTTCAATRNAEAPTDLSVGCVWPVDGATTIALEIAAAREGSTTATDFAMTWAFLSAEAP